MFKVPGSVSVIVIIMFYVYLTDMVGSLLWNRNQCSIFTVAHLRSIGYTLKLMETTPVNKSFKQSNLKLHWFVGS